MFKAEEVDKKFVWLGKVQKAKRINGRSKPDADISIMRWSTAKKNADGSKNYRYGFTIRNDAVKVLGDYADVAVYKNRVLFKPCAESEGYKLSASSKSTGTKCPNKYFSIAKTEYSQELEDFIGDYELQYDKFYEVYYVEKEDKNDTK